MVNKESSDEKLLKLIEGTVASKQKQSPDGLKPAFRIPPPRPRAGFSFKALNLKSLFKINLYTLNRIFFVLAFIFTSIFIGNFISGSKKVNLDLLFASLTAKETAAAKPLITDTKGFLSLGEYLSAIERRNIFLPWGQKPAAEAQDKALQTVKSEELVKDLKLVGIIWSENPEAIIESALDGRTSLVKKADTVGQARAKVKEITKNAVILEIEIEGQKKEYELR